jgi:diguanylate cyclase (GGDEF)-like protein/PAS domain S-box-containing protein
MLGFSRDELLELEMPWPFTPPQSLELNHAITERLSLDALQSDAGPSDPIEVPLMRKDGSRFVGEFTVAPARDADGAILGWVSTIRDVSGRHDYEVELERLATHDPLTGLANRRLFEERLDQEMAGAIRHGRSLAVAILDLDHFKSVNDRFGHPAGDDALRESSSRLERILRKGDLLARVGGEEFAWILPEVLSHGAWAAVERARHAISDTPFEAAGDLTISIGVALRGDLQDAAQLYEHADESLYRAKREGRDCSIMWRSL